MTPITFADLEYKCLAQYQDYLRQRDARGRCMRHPEHWALDCPQCRLDAIGAGGLTYMERIRKLKTKCGVPANYQDIELKHLQEPARTLMRNWGYSGDPLRVLITGKPSLRIGTSAVAVNDLLERTRTGVAAIAMHTWMTSSGRLEEEYFRRMDEREVKKPAEGLFWRLRLVRRLVIELDASPSPGFRLKIGRALRQRAIYRRKTIATTGMTIRELARDYTGDFVDWMRGGEVIEL